MADFTRLLSGIQPHRLVMTCLFAGALTTGWLMLPGLSERVAMLERDGHNRQALLLLEERYKTGDRSTRLLYQLQQLYEHFGDIENAKLTLEQLAVTQRRDANLRQQLSLFYRSTQNEQSYIQALERQIERRYSDQACQELVGIHRRNGDYVAEKAALERCRALGHRRPDDLIRLAQMMIVDKDSRSAVRVLRAIDDRLRLRDERDRLTLFSVLLETQQDSEAIRRATRWIRTSPVTAFGPDIVEMLVASNRSDLALRLARSAGRPGDALSLTVAELLLDKDEGVAARAFLRGWLEDANPRISTTEMAGRFVENALDADDPELAYEGAVKFGLENTPQVDLGMLAEALSATGRTDALAAVRKHLKKETIDANPLLAASIAVDNGQLELAREHLAKVDEHAVDEWRLALWSGLMQRAGATALQAAKLNALGNQSAGGAKEVTKQTAKSRRASTTRNRRRGRARRLPTSKQQLTVRQRARVKSAGRKAKGPDS